MANSELSKLKILFIYDYFKNEAASDSVDEAIQALGADYDEMEIRLVRLKFLCEIAS